MTLKRQINDFGVQNVKNVGNRNVQKRQINDFGVQNVGNRNVQKRQINEMTLVYKMQEIEMSKNDR